MSARNQIDKHLPMPKCIYQNVNKPSDTKLNYQTLNRNSFRRDPGNDGFSHIRLSIPRAVGLPGVMTDTTFTTVHRPIAASDLNVSIPRAVGLPGVITVTVTNKYF